MSAVMLVLRDVHQPPAPSWWPPAPGWWALAAVIVLVAAAATWWVMRRRRRRARILALFDDAVAAADSPVAQIAAVSELLRRAARSRNQAADRLQGEAWLQFLDEGDESAPFSRGVGRLLLDGPYRAVADPDHARALQALARKRFCNWMGVR